MRVEDLDTPSVTIHMDRLEANISRVQAMVDARGIANRPHVKTHKIPAIGKMQIEAGAIGLTCQKLGEVEAFVRAGVCDDILLSFNIVGDRKTDRLMELSSEIRRLAVVADNETVIDGLAEAGRRHGRDVPLLIECDTGFGRNGASTPERVLELARHATAQPRIAFEGIMTFPNTPPANGFVERTLDLLRRSGIPVPIVSGGGTPALLTIQRFPAGELDVIYAHNDGMALGAVAALEAAGRLGDVKVVGIDGEEAAYQAIKDGTMAATFTYHFVAPEGMMYAWDIAQGKTLDAKIVLPTAQIDATNVDQFLGTGF